MDEIIVKGNIKIEDMIYEIRGKQVILDRDLAKLYNIETKVFMQSVKRNIERFPDSFMFQLTSEEFLNWRSQIVTSKNDKIGLRRPPYVFTEQGVAMLSGILRSKIAINTSILIIEAFVTMRKYISTNLIEQKYINEIVLKDSKRIDLLEESFSKMEEKKNHLFFDGQIYDAYSKILDIFKSAKEELIIIDGYADKTALDIMSQIKVDVILIVKAKTLLTKLDIEKYNKQYNNLQIIYNDTFHDRYFILDRNIIYHCGTSINHAGSKTFSINLLDDKIIIENLINNLRDIL